MDVYYIQDNTQDTKVLYSLRYLNTSSPTFWLGLLAGLIFAWLLYRFFRYLPKSIKFLRETTDTIKEVFSPNAENRLRNDVYHYAQKQHLAISMFSLDEIAITPRVLTPVICTPKAIDAVPSDSVSLTLPYIPDWPELAAFYRASTMTLIEALQGGANIILAGHPGSGKTVALAWLASTIARNAPGLGLLEGKLPLFINAIDLYYLLRSPRSEATETGDLNLESDLDADLYPTKELKPDELLETLVRVISTYVTPVTLSNLPSIVRSSLSKQRAILLIDRFDELPPRQASTITHFIKSFRVSYPSIRIISASSFENLNGLPTLGFSLLAMAAWGDEEREEFLLRWSRLWNKFISAPDKKHSKRIDTHYLNSWLKTNNSLLNPLEYTLKVWAAYCGDILGIDGPSSIEAYILRMTNDVSKERLSLEQFALQTLIEMNPIAHPHDAKRLFSKYEKEAKPDDAEPSEETKPSEQQDTPKPVRFKELTDIEPLINNGFLASYPGSRYGFSHPIFGGYLAGAALAGRETTFNIQNQPAWIGRTLGLYYLARSGDVAPFINGLIQEDDILHTNHLLISRWLQVAPKNRPWRTIILRTLALILQKEKDTTSLSAKIISALAFSGDAGVSIYFRQLLKSDHPILRQLAALGSGILADKKAIEDLNILLQEQSPSSIRAASLAFVGIGDKQSLEILATNLLNGNEFARRYAAEALANNQSEGHPALKEGSAMEDLMVRRSVAFGLIRVNQPWAVKILENLQLSDNEWVVRNAAIQAFDELRRKNSYAPSPLPDPTEIQWLIDYATKIGTTVAPGKPADELVVKALANGTKDEISNALDYLRSKCDPGAIDYIYSTYKNNLGDIKDVAYYVLWLMMIAGIKLPLAIKYDIK